MRSTMNVLKGLLRKQVEQQKQADFKIPVINSVFPN